MKLLWLTWVVRPLLWPLRSALYAPLELCAFLGWVPTLEFVNFILWLDGPLSRAITYKGPDDHDESATHADAP
jgi:hypothetical protein